MTFGLKFAVLLKGGRICGNTDFDKVPSKKVFEVQLSLMVTFRNKRMTKRSRKLAHFKTKMYLTHFECGRLT